jgi:hypothetical protein
VKRDRYLAARISFVELTSVPECRVSKSSVPYRRGGCQRNKSTTAAALEIGGEGQRSTAARLA